MNRKQQKHELFITFMAHLKPAKRKRPAPVNLKKLRSLIKQYILF